MKILNLIHQDQSEIKYSHSRFSDTAVNFVVNDSVNDSVLIVCRITSFFDIELLASAYYSLYRMKVQKISLYITYLLGARADKKFVDGSCLYLKDVVGTYLNTMNFSDVFIFDAHSDVSFTAINNSIPISNVDFVTNVLTELRLGGNKDIAVVSPDGGALKKVYDTLSAYTHDLQLILSAKHRDVKTGKLNGFFVPITESTKNSTLVWVDDICDGGGTFMGEAELAKTNGALGKMVLVVSHGIFPPNMKQLTSVFDEIYTTNSFRTFNENDEFIIRNEKYLNNFHVHDITSTQAVKKIISNYGY